jgi:hypothetical protein
MPIQDHPFAVWLRGLPLLASPGWFTCVVWAAYACGLGLVVARNAIGPGSSLLLRMLFSDQATLISQAIVLVVARLPCLAFEFELQQDESQMAAQAITLLHDPVFYASVDGGSGGPLLSYMLWLPVLLGQEIDFFTARATGLLLWWLTVVGLFLTVRRSAGAVAADVASWATTAVYALSSQIDFMSYQSELLPAAIVSWACFVLFSLGSEPKTTKGPRALVLGFLCGSLPFSKLQAGPIGVMLAVLGYNAVFAAPTDPATRWRAARWLTVGGLTVPIAFFALFGFAGVFGRFLQLYLGYGVAYAAAGSSTDGLLTEYFRLPLASRETGWEGLVLALVVTAVVAAIGLVRSGLSPLRSMRKELVAAGLILAAACFAALAPGRCYLHYLTLTIQPASLLLGLLLAEPHGTGDRRVLQAVHAGVAVFVFSLAVAWPWAAHQPTSKQIVVHRSAYESPRVIFPALDTLVRLSRPGDRLATWGWQASYHVYAGMPQGWLGASPVLVPFQAELTPLERSMMIGSGIQLDELKRLYLDSFQRHQPRFVIDVTGPNAAMFKNRARFGLHAWPELATVVAREYDLVFASDVDQLYVRRFP